MVILSQPNIHLNQQKPFSPSDMKRFFITNCTPAIIYLEI